jgi:thiamine-phosphate pyrophosphorylase
LAKIDFRLILVTDRKLLNEISLRSFIAQCCVYGIKAVQLRERDLPDRELYLLAKNIRAATKKNSAKLLVNDRIDIALLTKSNGVHSPEKGISSKIIKSFNSGFLTGSSVHSLQSAQNAEKEGFDYIICGPVFETPSKKKYGKPLGLFTLNKICNSVNIPVFAIGGITSDKVKDCLESGAHGVGVISAIFKSDDLLETINEFKTELGGL